MRETGKDKQVAQLHDSNMMMVVVVVVVMKYEKKNAVTII